MLIVLVNFLPLVLYAEDQRTIPLDVYLVIDCSSSLEPSKPDTIAWINDQVIDRILMDGDKITIWSAGAEAQVTHSAVISGTAGKEEIRNKLNELNTGGRTADFSGALRDVQSRISQTSGDPGRLPYTILITASARGLEPALTGGSQGLFRWFRSERYEGWQVLIVGLDIGRKVQQAASAYMNSR